MNKDVRIRYFSKTKGAREQKNLGNPDSKALDSYSYE